MENFPLLPGFLYIYTFHLVQDFFHQPYYIKETNGGVLGWLAPWTATRTRQAWRFHCLDRFRSNQADAGVKSLSRLELTSLEKNTLCCLVFGLLKGGEMQVTTCHHSSWVFWHKRGWRKGNWDKWRFGNVLYFFLAFQWFLWVVVSFILYFHSDLWRNDPIWLIFFTWVETTN